MATTGDFDTHIHTLKGGPSPEEASQCLSYCMQRRLTREQQFKVATTVLETTIPQLFCVSDKSVQKLIVRSVQTLSGLGGLVNKIRHLVEQGARHESVEMYVEVLAMALDGTLLRTLEAKSVAETNEVNKLLFKGGCLAVANEARVAGVAVSGQVFASTDAYVEYLTRLLVADGTPQFGKYLMSVLGLSETSQAVVFDVVFVEHTWPQFVSKMSSLKSFERKSVLVSLLGFIARRRIADCHDKVHALAAILQETGPVDTGVVEKAVRMSDRNINSLVALLVGQNSGVFSEMLSSWGDASTIKTESIAVQESRTHLLIQMLYLQDSRFCRSFMDSPQFLDSVSNRLGSYSGAVKIFGVVLADKVCDLAGSDRIFSIDDLEGYEHLAEDTAYVLKSENHANDAWAVLHAPVVEPVDESGTVADQLATVSLHRTYKDSDDESSDSDDDDPSVVSRAKISPPIYIKQLVQYLRTNKDHPQAFDMVKIALEAGPSLVRQKAHFGAELDNNATDLLQVLVGLSNDFNMANFDDLKLNGLIAVVVGAPKRAVDLIEMLGTGDYSLQQRMMILSAVSLSARDIRGFRDEVVARSYKEKAFPTKTLPSQLHNLYLGMDGQQPGTDYVPEALKAAHLFIQDSLIKDESEKAKDQLAGGKILRISRKLQPSSQQSAIKPRYDNYSVILSRNFYFPLAHLWYESGGISIGHYSGVLTGHYLKTLALLLHCSYASVTNNDMIREFLIISHQIVQNTTMHELQVVEGIVTGVLLICDISDEQHLVINFGDYLSAIHTWVADSWDTIIDDRIKSLCAGFLLRITGIFEKYQAFMLDRVNSIY